MVPVRLTMICTGTSGVTLLRTTKLRSAVIVRGRPGGGSAAVAAAVQLSAARACVAACVATEERDHVLRVCDIQGSVSKRCGGRVAADRAAPHTTAHPKISELVVRRGPSQAIPMPPDVHGCDAVLLQP
jgi:hypothetical protein